MTTIPITLTPDRLCEFYGTINAICLAEIGRLPPWDSPTDLVANIMLLMALQGQTGDGLTRWLSAQPEAVGYRNRMKQP